MKGQWYQTVIIVAYAGNRGAVRGENPVARTDNFTQNECEKGEKNKPYQQSLVMPEFL